MVEESEARHKIFDIKHQNGLTQIMSCLTYCQKRVIHRSQLRPCKHFLSVTGAVYRAGVTGSKECFVWPLVLRTLRQGHCANLEGRVSGTCYKQN